MRPTINNPVLVTWKGLNSYLQTANELECRLLLEEEMAGRARRQYLLRIHSRLNRMRTYREKEELSNAATPPSSN